MDVRKSMVHHQCCARRMHQHALWHTYMRYISGTKWSSCVIFALQGTVASACGCRTFAPLLVCETYAERVFLWPFFKVYVKLEFVTLEGNVWKNAACYFYLFIFNVNVAHLVPCPLSCLCAWWMSRAVPWEHCDALPLVAVMCQFYPDRWSLSLFPVSINPLFYF